MRDLSFPTKGFVDNGAFSPRRGLNSIIRLKGTGRKSVTLKISLCRRRRASPRSFRRLNSL